jgi:hypothetical protein
MIDGIKKDNEEIFMRPTVKQNKLPLRRTLVRIVFKAQQVEVTVALQFNQGE